ncbi:MAG: bifunctional oligoribonuclease/PAP phosphatase NrnA [Fimbriimonadia bacterium]
MNTPTDAAEVLRGAQRIAIGCHVNPDGDTMGSALALSFALDALGKTTILLCHDAVPDNLRFLPASERFGNDPEGFEADLGLLVDLEGMGRLGQLAGYFSSLPRLVTIDHHQPQDAVGDVRVIDTSAASTSEIAYRVILEMDVPFTVDMATALLTGLITDTGGFRFPNTRPDHLELAAKWVRTGASLTSIFEHAYENRSFSAQQLMGRALAGLQRSADGQTVWSALALRDFEETGCTDADTDGIVNHLRAIQDAEVAVLFREARPGKVRVSLRSKGQMDVAAIAHKLGGGGHRNAAGCSFDGSLDNAVKTTLAEVAKWTGSLS